MKSARFPFIHGNLAIHSRLPADFQPFHQTLENPEVDDVVFDYQDVDWWDGRVV